MRVISRGVWDYLGLAVQDDWEGKVGERPLRMDQRGTEYRGTSTLVSSQGSYRIHPPLLRILNEQIGIGTESFRLPLGRGRSLSIVLEHRNI